MLDQNTNFLMQSFKDSKFLADEKTSVKVYLLICTMYHICLSVESSEIIDRLIALHFKATKLVSQYYGS